MTARTRGKLMRWLATGTAAAGVSASLVGLPSAEAGWWFGSKSSEVEQSVRPRVLAPSTTSVAQPLQLSDPLIHQTVSRRRQRRQQLLQELKGNNPEQKSDTDQKSAGAQPQSQPQLELDEPGFSPSLAEPRAAQQPVFEFEKPAAQAAQPQASQELSPIQRELQRLYEEGGAQMPAMSDASGGQQRIQLQQRPGAAAQPIQPAPAVVAAPPAASIAEPEPEEAFSEPPKRKGLLGLFGFRKSKEELEEPPAEPRPYVPQSAMRSLTEEAETEAEMEFEAVEEEQEAATVELDSIDDEESAPTPVNPLRARNYQADLFGPPRESDGVAQVVIPAAPESAPADNAGLGFEEDPELEMEDGLNFEGEPTPFAARSATTVEEPLPPVPQTTAPAAVEEDPYTGLKLDDDPFGASNAPVPLPPEDPFGNSSAARQKPRGQVTPRLASVSREESPAGRSISMKRERIASRSTQPGLKGFCPVCLRDDRELSDGLSEFRAEFEGKTYYLASAESLSKFLTSPSRYAPTERGIDVVERSKSRTEVEGSLDHSVWYKGRLYLFASVESLQAFVAAPAAYASEK